jgi:Ca2+-binding RTX toxin-like protein
VDDVGDVVVEGVNSFLNGFDTVYASITETLDANVETLILTGASAISGYGNTLNNSITGNGAGNVIDGKTGADTMTGLAGNDFYYVDNVADTVVEANGVVDGIDTVFSSVTYTITDVDVESLFLTGVGANNGTGNASNNTVSGNGADNTLSGLGGGDTIYGNSGNDTLFGGTGSDTLSGGLGNDLLYAQDAVVANDGLEDRFVFNTTLDTAAVSKGLAPTNVDQIGMAFFGAGMEGVDDEFQLENSIFTALTAVGGGTVGTLANYYEGATATFTGDGTLDFAGIYLNTSNGYLYYNPTSNVANDSVLIAVVNNTIPGGSLSLSAEEFTLI